MGKQRYPLKIIYINVEIFSHKNIFEILHKKQEFYVYCRNNIIFKLGYPIYLRSSSVYRKTKGGREDGRCIIHMDRGRSRMSGRQKPDITLAVSTGSVLN